MLLPGTNRLDQFTKVTEEEVLRLHGMGQKALDLIRDALAAKGKAFANEKASTK